MVLYINACVRSESRTDKIARHLLSKLGEFKEVKLREEKLLPLSEERLNKRTAYIEKADYTDEMFKYAKDFSSADVIVIAAPYWDLSFPSCLKVYLENIYVTGLVSRYGEDGRPVGLCRAKMLYYVTTAGGPYNPSFSYGYIEELAKNYLGVKETRLIKAEMLDVTGFESEKIVEETMNRVDDMFV